MLARAVQGKGTWGFFASRRPARATCVIPIPRGLGAGNQSVSPTPKNLFALHVAVDRTHMWNGGVSESIKLI
jgi:hypothetical protein